MRELSRVRLPPSDFGKAVGEVFRGIRGEVMERPDPPADPNSPRHGNAIDRSVREQVISDLDGLIKKHDG